MDPIKELDAVIAEENERVATVLTRLEEELSACRAHCSELERAIARARGRLDPSADSQPRGPARVTLHEAMGRLLEEAGPEGLSGPELLHAINDRGLYRQRDGGPVTINQIHARAQNYAELFDKRKGRFVLRHAPEV